MNNKVVSGIWVFIKKYFFLIGLLIFLYFPVIFIIVFSFSGGSNFSKIPSFTLDNYEDLFKHEPFKQALTTTVYVSIISTFASIIIGSLASACLVKLNRMFRSSILGASRIQIIMPDLIIGFSLFLLFTIINVSLGTFTLIISHIAFSSPYVMFVMYPRINKLDRNQIFASYDLGASRIRTFFQVILPQLAGPLISASIIAFVMSFDDFVISFFVSGSQNNISTFLFSLKKPTFIVNAFATIIVVISAFLVFNGSFISYRKNKKRIRNA